MRAARAPSDYIRLRELRLRSIAFKANRPKIPECLVHAVHGGFASGRVPCERKKGQECALYLES